MAVVQTLLSTFVGTVTTTSVAKSWYRSLFWFCLSDCFLKDFVQTFSNTFSWISLVVSLLIFHWCLFLGIKLTISQHWFRLWLGTKQVPSHYLNQWWHSNMMPYDITRLLYSITRPQRVNHKTDPDHMFLFLLLPLSGHTFIDYSMQGW